MDMIAKVKELFEADDLYAAYKITKSDADDPKKLRSAYLRSALSFHPDKNSEVGATEKFQLLSSVYELLKDDDTRKYYNDTGKLPDDKTAFDPDVYSAKIDELMLRDFQKTYDGSDEEKQDFIKFYNEGKGSMVYLAKNMYFFDVTNVDDVKKFENLVQEAVKDGLVEKFPEEKGSKTKWKRYINKMQKEAKEAQELLAELQEKKGRGAKRPADSVQDSLAAMILAKRDEQCAFLDQLEAKYSKKSVNQKKRMK